MAYAQENSHSLTKKCGREILVIDDDNDLLEVISWALDHAGFTVTSFTDPHLALESLEKGTHHPSLIVVDYYMEKMKGGEFVSLKKAIADKSVQECPVMIISGSPHDVESEVADNLFSEVISKPIDLDALIRKIEEYEHQERNPLS